MYIATFQCKIYVFDCIELNSFVRLVCIPYLMKHRSLLNGLGIDKFHETFVKAVH